MYTENAPVLTKYRIKLFLTNRSKFPAIYAAYAAFRYGFKPSHRVYCYIILSDNCR